MRSNIYDAMRSNVYDALRHVRPAPLASALKRMLRVKRVVTNAEFGQMWVDPVSAMGAAIISTRQYEPDFVALIRANLPVGGVFLDIGANEGVFSIVAAKTASRVIAVEPQSRLIPVIQENLRLNGIENVTIIRAAISDQLGTGTLHLSSDMNNGSTALSRNTRYPGMTETTPLMPLTELFDQLSLETVDFMKMDIEGYEYEAILGSPEIFQKQRIRAFCVEFHLDHLEARGKSGQIILDFLDRCGYDHSRRRWWPGFETHIMTIRN
jgi:FkbM family methyltransferase